MVNQKSRVLRPYRVKVLVDHHRYPWYQKLSFLVLGGFGLWGWLWGKAKVYPDVPYWRMCVTLIPLCLLSGAWVLVVGCIILAIAFACEAVGWCWRSIR